MKYQFTVLLLLASRFLFAQGGPLPPEYVKAVEIALGELQKGQCQPCLEAYERAFAISQHSALSHLRAARCAQLCHDEVKAKAFADKAVEISCATALKVMDDQEQYPELDAFRQSDLGKKTLVNIEATAKASGLNLGLLKELDQLKKDDQRPRLEMDAISTKYPKNSPEYQQFMHDWEINDSICLAKAEAIIQQFGYPGKTMVGADRQDVIWLVIQHAPLAKQEQYFPLLDEAAQKGELSKSAWALLVDRIRMYKGQPQIYGSQVVSDENGKSKFYEIEDEANVNKRRAEVGLGPLEEYAKHFGMEWKPK